MTLPVSPQRAPHSRASRRGRDDEPASRLPAASHLHDAPLRVLLADCSGPARRALAHLVRELDGVVLAGEVGDREQLAARLRGAAIDVLLIDDRLLLPGDDLGSLLGMRNTHTPVLVVGVDDDPGFAARAARLGAEAWIPKDCADERLPALLSPCHREA